MPSKLFVTFKKHCIWQRLAVGEARIKLDVVKLDVVKLDVVKLDVVKLDVVKLDVVKLDVVKLYVVKLYVVKLYVVKLYVVKLYVVKPLVPLVLLGPPFFPIILFLSSTLLTGMTINSLRMQWPLTSQSHGSIHTYPQFLYIHGLAKKCHVKVGT
jgi:hypothetical protein